MRHIDITISMQNSVYSCIKYTQLTSACTTEILTTNYPMCSFILQNKQLQITACLQDGQTIKS